MAFKCESHTFIPEGNQYIFERIIFHMSWNHVFESYSPEPITRNNSSKENGPLLVTYWDRPVRVSTPS